MKKNQLPYLYMFKLINSTQQYFFCWGCPKSRESINIHWWNNLQYLLPKQSSQTSDVTTTTTNVAWAIWFHANQENGHCKQGNMTSAVTDHESKQFWYCFHIMWHQFQSIESILKFVLPLVSTINICLNRINLGTGLKIANIVLILCLRNIRYGEEGNIRYQSFKNVVQFSIWAHNNNI